MSTANPTTFTAAEYERFAQEYLESLPLSHFMEATPQATQRKITLESFDVVQVHRPDIQLYNELLVQYPRRGRRKPGQVVPDNMALCHKEEVKAVGSFDVELQPVGPLVVMEYVSKSSKRKDYEKNFSKYQNDLRVPYYLLFYPETQDLQLFRHTGKKYVSVPANEHGRHPIPELEIEVALLDGWVRYWFRGELVPLTGDLVRQMGEIQARLKAAEQRAAKAEQDKQRAEQDKQRAEHDKQRAEQDKQRAEDDKQRAEQLANTTQQLLDQERQEKLALTQELERLRAQLKQG